MPRDPIDSQAVFLAVYQEITRLVSMVHDPQSVMTLVVDRLPGLLDVDAATIRLLDRQTNQFVIGAAHGLSEEYLARKRIDSSTVMSELLKGRPMERSALPVHIDRETREEASREGIENVLSLPIMYQAEVIGLLRLLTRKKRMFSGAEVAFAMSLAEQVGIAISNSRMYQELAQQIDYLTELRDISRIVHSTLDLNEVLGSIVEKLSSVMKVQGCTIRLQNLATNQLELVAAAGLSDDYLNRSSTGREDTIFAALQGEPVAVYDAVSDPRIHDHDAIRAEGIQSLLAVPIRNKLEIIGVLRLLSRQPRTFSPAEINFVVTAAEEGGNAIQKARTYRQITLLFNQIEENERFLQTIMDSLWLQLIVLSSDRRVVMVNREFLEQNRLREEAVIGRDYYEISPWSKAAGTGCPIDHILAHGSPVALQDEIEMKGRRCWFERHLTPVVDDQGQVEFIIEAAQDITDLKLLERERLARTKLQGVLEMAGTTAHKLNSPLFAALGMAQLLQEDLASTKAADDLAMIVKNLEHIKELTREMVSATGFERRNYVGATNIVELKW
ncbi:MAG: GAF domain-containing protein [Desulfofustis sp.]|nr:GAF domain-containing protein [Desulfofustis sp.]